MKREKECDDKWVFHTSIISNYKRETRAEYPFLKFPALIFLFKNWIFQMFKPPYFNLYRTSSFVFWIENQFRLPTFLGTKKKEYFVYIYYV